MRFNLSTAVVFATISVSQATVLLPRSPYHQFLNARQAGPCDAACATFSAALDRCTTPACLCVAPVQAGLQSCVNCALTGNPSKDVIQTAQDLVDSFQGICSGSGLSPVTIKVTPTPPTTPVVSPPVVTPITTPPVVVTPPGPVVTSTTVVPGTTVTNVNTLSQTVIRPASTTDAATGTGVSTPVQNGGFGLYQVAHGIGLSVALFLGTLLAI
ncbi:hypothetical protein M413DRAFT_185031 [Hebeloma cylindrosporum]|uniref:Extracellular membrane protein CFEM domain-containing protein n=1 Tax=Hebeloma cylindrosporum TaxID=76867 RepID=A0A0C3BT34_HEBCY|nr:hypothetical protein M413DRAFT_185031 [Hebeloma cylindrosporum h7]